MSNNYSLNCKNNACCSFYYTPNQKNLKNHFKKYA